MAAYGPDIISQAPFQTALIFEESKILETDTTSQKVSKTSKISFIW